MDPLVARAWIDDFFDLYAGEHHYSGIKYVTPNQRHYDEADAIWAIQQQTY